MTSQRDLWYAYVQEYCNTDFGGVSVAEAPASIQLAVDKLVTAAANRAPGIKSRTVQGVVVESATPEALPKEIRVLLNRHRKVKIVE